MKKKYIILTIGLIIFIVIVYFLYNPSNSNTGFKKKKEDVNHNESIKVTKDVDLIDYLNLEGENRKLNEEIDVLKSQIFELKKLIAESESNDIDHYYNSGNFLYKEVRDKEIILLSEDNDSSYILSITTREESLVDYINDLNDKEVINYTGTDGFYSGLIDGNVINDVIVKVNGKSYNAEIVNFADNISFWYAIYEHKRKSTLEKPDKITIMAINEMDEVLWEESFDGNLGG